MPVFIAWIGEMLLSQVGQMVLSAAVALGIGFVANKAGSGLIDYSGIKSQFAAAGPLIAWIGVLRIDTAITVILSAWAGRRIVDGAKAFLAAMPKSSGSGSK